MEGPPRGSASVVLYSHSLFLFLDVKGAEQSFKLYPTSLHLTKLKQLKEVK